MRSTLFVYFYQKLLTKIIIPSMTVIKETNAARKIWTQSTNP